MVRRRLRRWVFFGFSLGGVLLVSATEAADAPAGMEERVKEITTMLAPRPAAFGRPITDREAWGRLAKHETFRGVVSGAERYLSLPVPELPDELFTDYARTGDRRSLPRAGRSCRGAGHDGPVRDDGQRPVQRFRGVAVPVAVGVHPGGRR